MNDLLKHLVWAVILILVIGITVDLVLQNQIGTKQRKEHRLSEAQSIAHLGNWEIDISRDSVWISDEACRILGVTVGDAPKDRKALLSYIPDRDRLELDRAMTELGKERREFSLDHEIRTSERTRFVHTQGRILSTSEGETIRIAGTTLDITDRKRIEEALRGEEEKLRAMSEASYDALIMIDSEGRITFWNTAAEQLFGYTADELVGGLLHPYIALEDDVRKAERGMPAFARTGNGQVIGNIQEFTAKHKSGRTFPVERSVSSFRIGHEWFAVGILRDITERKATEARLVQLATTDLLTGLPNRRKFMEVFEDDFQRARRYGRPLSVLMFDVDHFKSVNDAHGDDAGDLVLKVLSEICRSTIRQTDTPGRIGGEEFAVSLPETGGTDARSLAERLRVSVEKTPISLPAGHSETALTVTISIGTTTYTDSYETPEQMLKSADLALYDAKRSGRNRVKVSGDG